MPLPSGWRLYSSQSPSTDRRSFLVSIEKPATTNVVTGTLSIDPESYFNPSSLEFGVFTEAGNNKLVFLPSEAATTESEFVWASNWTDQDFFSASSLAVRFIGNVDGAEWVETVDIPIENNPLVVAGYPLPEGYHVSFSPNPMQRSFGQVQITLTVPPNLDTGTVVKYTASWDDDFFYQYHAIPIVGKQTVYTITSTVPFDIPLEMQQVIFLINGIGGSGDVTGTGNYFLEVEDGSAGGDQSESGLPYVVPNWIAESAIDENNTSFLMFRHDLRNTIYNAIDTKVRDVVYSQISNMFDFNPSDDLSQFHITMASNSERVERIDSYIKNIEYNTERILNLLGEPQIQAIYASIYSKLQELDNNLGDMIDNTLAKTVENYERSEMLVAELEAKAKEETLIQYSTMLTSYPKDRIVFRLHSQHSNQSWDISSYVTIKEGQMVLTLPSIENLTGADSIDQFAPWYIQVWPKSESISVYSVIGKNLVFSTNKDLTDILWSTVYDINGQSYKIINYKDAESGRVFILDKSFGNNALGQPIVIQYNYFDPQIIKLNVAWLHNYIPKGIPVGSLYQPVQDNPVVIPPTQPAQNLSNVVRGNTRKEIKEIF